MIKVVILEDEIPARNKIKRFLEGLEEPVEVVAEVDNIVEGVRILSQIQPDLILSDIELLDGTSFEIFNQASVTCPIIFTTAYDQYWMNAFDSNGIAYLLKPFSKDQFLKAWSKFQLLAGTTKNSNVQIARLLKQMEQHLAKKEYKKRFSVIHRKGIQLLEVGEIVFFEATEGVVIAHDNTGKKHPMQEATLNEIEELLDPSMFFRINRSELVQKAYIERMEYHNKNAISISLKSTKRVLITSQSKTAEFRRWVEI